MRTVVVRAVIVRAVTVLAVTVLAAAACSSDDTDSAQPPTTPPAASSTTASTTASTTTASTTTSTSTSTSTTTSSTTTSTTTTTTAPPPSVPVTPRPTTPPATTPPVAPYTGDPDTFRQPMNGRVYVTLAWDCGGCVTELGSKHHPAIDYKSRDDDTIVAAGDGVVVRFNDGCDSPSQGCGESMGNSVFLRHTLADGSVMFTFYAHMAELDPAISMGACLKQGQRVGLMGNSGIGSAAHLHFAFQTEPEILQYTVASSYESGSRNPDDYYGTVKVQRCA